MGRNRDERGTVAIVVGVASLVLVLIAAFAVDLGMQRIVRRDMQALADVVALDLARRLDGSAAADLTSAMNDARDASVERNDDTLGEDPTVTYRLGGVDDDGEFDDSVDPPTAVEVTASSSVDFAFFSGDGGAARTAVAEKQDSGCFKIGTMALGLATNNSALNGILGDALNLGVLGYNGLVNANVSLLGLEAELTALDPDGVLDLEQVSLGDLVLATATVLSNTPGAESADITLLNTIATQLDLAGEDDTIINVADMLDVGQGGGSAVDTQINVLDLISGAAFVANGDTAIVVPGLNLNIPGLANITTRLTVVERPRRGCKPGSGEAQTSQVRLEITGNLNIGVPLVATVTGPLTISVNLADALARLLKVNCTDGEPDSLRIDVEEQTLASVTVNLAQLTAKAVLGIINVPLLGLTVQTTQPSPTGTYTVPLPTYYEMNPYQTPQTPATLPNITVQQLTLLGLNLGTILNPVLNTLLNPLLSTINGVIANTLAPALGLRIAGVDLFGVRTPTCAGPRLVG